MHLEKGCYIGIFFMSIIVIINLHKLQTGNYLGCTDSHAFLHLQTAQNF